MSPLSLRKTGAPQAGACRTVGGRRFDRAFCLLRPTVQRELVADNLPIATINDDSEMRPVVHPQGICVTSIAQRSSLRLARLTQPRTRGRGVKGLLMHQPPLLLQHPIHLSSIHNDPFLPPEQRQEVPISDPRSDAAESTGGAARSKVGPPPTVVFRSSPDDASPLGPLPTSDNCSVSRHPTARPSRVGCIRA